MLALKQRIVVECLHCGHRGTLREEDLAAYGEKPGAHATNHVPTR